MRRRLGLSAVLVAALVVTGCGSKQEPKAAPQPAPSASPTAPPGVDAEPPERPAEVRNSPTSAVEYATWFAQLVRYALEYRDSSVVDAEALDQPACSGCQSLSTFVAKLERTGYWQVSDVLDMGELKASTRKGVVRVQGSFTFPKVRDLTVDGTVAKTIPAKPYDYYVDLSWDEQGGSWQVRDFYFQERA